MKNQSSISHSSPGISPDSNNATRKLQDEINVLTKRNCGKVIFKLRYFSSISLNHSIDIRSSYSI